VLQLDERPGPAPRISDDAAFGLVAEALAVAGEPAREVVTGGAWRRRSVGGWIRRPLAFAAMVTLLASGLSAAAYVAGRHLVRIRAEEPAAIETAPAPVAAPPPRPVRKLRPPPLDGEVLAPVRPLAPPPEMLLAGANDLRRRGAWARAERAYARVAVEARGTATARSAALAAAALELEHLDQPRVALRRYQALLRERLPATLDEEARWGIVECHRRLDDRRAEAEALRALIGAHPGGILRARAESRLAALTGL
jgi:hypothetical protein